MPPIPLFEINPKLDRAHYAQLFASDLRVQIRDLLTEETARTVHRILKQETPWGLAWQAGEDGPHGLRQADVNQLSQGDRAEIGAKVGQAARGSDYSFLYGQYRILDAYLEKWAPGSPHDLLLEYINAPDLLSLVREVTGIPELLKADAQATLYAPHHFLSVHNDSHKAEGWRIAYVMSFCAEEWRPEWGGYLLFYDEEGDIIKGFRPRFNALNLFRVPQKHSVSYVPGFAPVGRFAITGWFRDR